MSLFKLPSKVYLGLTMTTNNKNDRNNWGKCPGLPITSYCLKATKQQENDKLA